MSARSTTSGSSTATSASKSPSREAARNASTTSRWRVEVGVGERVLALDAAARAAGELAGRRRGAVEDPRDLVEGHGEHVVQHEREPLGRAQRLEHDEQREADRVGQQRLVLGVGAVLAVTIGSGRCTPKDSSRRDRRERSMFSDTRATTVVSQPPRFSISRLSERLSRSQASCTASSASLSEPSIR